MKLATLMLTSLFASALVSAAYAGEPNKGAALLGRASRQGDLDRLRNLLTSGVDPNLADDVGSTALYNASSFNQIKAVELLLSFHADPDKQVKARRRGNTTPVTPLQSAAYLGNSQIAALLVDAGAHLNAVGEGKRSALDFAVIGNRLDVISFLIEKGADVNGRDAEGASALDYAVWGGSIDGAALLLAHGARLNEGEANTLSTPVNEAAFLGNTGMVRYLLQFHPDLDASDKNGFTPLENAARMGREETALLLFRAQANHSNQERIERTLKAAIAKNEVQLTKAMIQRGNLFSLNTALSLGPFPLEIAVSAGSADIVRLFLENGADPNQSSRQGASCLEDASLRGFTAVVQLLLEHRAVIDQINQASGRTALYVASSFGKLDVVKLLLAHGANPNLCGTNHLTAYQAALKSGFDEIASYLKRHGGAGSCQRE